MKRPARRSHSMNDNVTTESDRYFVAMAHERLADLDVVGARRVARQAATTSRDSTTLQRALARLRRAG